MVAASEPIVNAFSVDVEDWYQVADLEAVVPLDTWASQEVRIGRNTDRVLALLEEASVRGTFFILTWNAERDPGLVRRIADAGHEIASHGHAHRLVYTQTPEAFRADVARSKAILEDIIQRPVLGYRAPSFSITERSRWAIDVLIDEGFAYDSSVFPIRDPLYGMAGAKRFRHTLSGEGGRTLLEVPPSTMRVLGRNLATGGGGYFRVFPYAYTRWSMRRINQSDGEPAIFYIHPWELDPDQPVLRTRGHRGFSTHYVNLSQTEPRLRRLFEDFRFAPIRELLDAPVSPSGAGSA